MKKVCPDLVSLTDQELRDFWNSHLPSQLKRLGDRLLAESLPRWAPRGPEFYPADLEQRRLASNLSQSQMAQKLGVTAAIVEAWESLKVRPPASLALIYQRASA